ncbi:hypothetical protein ITJ54_07580 [Curtobacterium sp. VKM Ac-2865]|uniref:hypothetical protein n=1 Tax=Curtobacterium sp. VKM Ac-2865 TaxID=2783817 RepID=UPI00188A4203|nr:hypothetical protein [Curtobacterium sp. VKM Ac-2865]MBF4582526.1 hypothetical protein [Curtobacterium sp. VKM Ac-2865]
MHKTLAAVAALAAVTLTLTGCSQLHQQVGDAWAVTYQVSVDAPDASILHDVRYLGAEKRGDAATTRTISKAATRPGAAHGGVATWTHESIVLAKDPASVRATPPAGRTASCKILLDGQKVIAEEHGSAGKPVRCHAETPAFK